MVYVLNKNGKPLMPTERHGKVRRMLKEGKAKVVKAKPFTIHLAYETTTFTQDITLGIDAGYQKAVYVIGNPGLIIYEKQGAGWHRAYSISWTVISD